MSKGIRELNIEAWIVNRDYIPYSLQRDKKLEKVCKTGRIRFDSFDGGSPSSTRRDSEKNGKPYTIFTPYFRNASKQKVLSPAQTKGINYFHGSIPFAEDKSLVPKPTVENERMLA